MRTLRIYSLNNLPVYHTEVLPVVMLYVSSLVLDVSYNWKEGWKIVPFEHFLRIPPPPTLCL